MVKTKTKKKKKEKDNLYSQRAFHIYYGKGLLDRQNTSYGVTEVKKRPVLRTLRKSEEVLLRLFQDSKLLGYCFPRRARNDHGNHI